ncbi:WD40-repeat-containing domain protein [Lipomyces oligophaga]|uniref:WD40-repeat-containing domain protein n=1 Tax=Lipomyces oligophaga TaxID=45792 RepID=UPI0034CDF73D
MPAASSSLSRPASPPLSAVPVLGVSAVAVTSPANASGSLPALPVQHAVPRPIEVQPGLNSAPPRHLTAFNSPTIISHTLDAQIALTATSTTTTSTNGLPSPRLTALARLGQYFIGSASSSSTSSTLTSPPSSTSPTSSLSSSCPTPGFPGNSVVLSPPPHTRSAGPATSGIRLLPDHITFQTEAPLTAFTADPASNHVVLAGRGYMRVVRIDPDSINEADDLLRNFPDSSRLGYVSDLKWLTGPYSRSIAYASTNGMVTLHDIDQPGSIRRFSSGHSRMVNSLSYNYHNPNILISGGQDGTIRYWDLRTLENVSTVRGPDATRRVQFSPLNGSQFCAIFDTGTLCRWDSRNLAHPDIRITAHTGSGFCVDYHPTIDAVATGGRDHAIRVWDFRGELAHSPKPAFEISTSGAVSSAVWRSPEPWETNSITSLDDLPIASASLSVGDYRLQIWNLKRKYVPDRVIDLHSGPIQGVHWVCGGAFGSRVQDPRTYTDMEDESSDSELDAWSLSTIDRSNSIRRSRRRRARHHPTGDIWTCGRDNLFVAHNVRRSCPARPIRQLSHQAFAWGPNDEFTFIGIDKHRIRSDGLVAVDGFADSNESVTDLERIQLLRQRPSLPVRPTVERPSLVRRMLLARPRQEIALVPPLQNIRMGNLSDFIQETGEPETDSELPQLSDLHIVENYTSQETLTTATSTLSDDLSTSASARVFQTTALHTRPELSRSISGPSDEDIERQWRSV